MVVVDASALVEMLLGRPGGPVVAQHIADHDDDLHAPHLVDLEVTNALRRAIAAEEVSGERATYAFTTLLDLHIVRYDHASLLPRVWSLRDNMTAYDAAYVALAENVVEPGTPLLTTDARLARAAREHTRVEVLLAA